MAFLLFEAEALFFVLALLAEPSSLISLVYFVFLAGGMVIEFF
jgi:hypothetical protein